MRAELEARHLTQADLAQRTGLSAKHINQVLTATANMTPKVAWAIEQALGIDAGLLLSMEARWQATRVRQTSVHDLRAHVDWAARFPLAELRRRGLLASERGTQLVARLLAIFGVSSKESFEEIYLEGVVGFRRSQHNTVDELATATWLRIAELQVQRQALGEFDIQRLRRVIPRLRQLTHLDDDEGFLQARQLLAECGVALAFVRDLRGCRASGATKWLPSGRALVVVSDRYKKSDSMWFSLFHELAHVVLHPKRLTIVSLGDDGDDADGYEANANDYAAGIIVPPEHLPALDAAHATEDLVELADRLSVHVGLVAGQRAHRGGRPSDYGAVNSLRLRLDVSALERVAERRS